MVHRCSPKDAYCLATSCNWWSRLTSMGPTMRFTHSIPSWKADRLIPGNRELWLGSNRHPILWSFPRTMPSPLQAVSVRGGSAPWGSGLRWDS